MNWNPTYSYSTLPAGYNYDSIPQHWKTMLQKVEPAERGIPHFKDIYVSNVKVNFARKAFSAAGYDKSVLKNFNFNNVEINAATAGDITYAENWKLENINIKARDNSTIAIKNSTGVKL